MLPIHGKKRAFSKLHLTDALSSGKTGPTFASAYVRRKRFFRMLLPDQPPKLPFCGGWDFAPSFQKTARGDEPQVKLVWGGLFYVIDDVVLHRPFGGS